MMRILITGVNGYIGTSLSNILKIKYDVTTLSRNNFDLTDSSAMSNFFKSRHPFDVVIHCAVSGGSRLKKDDWDVMDVNLCMYYNLLQYRICYGKLIHFGSGAEKYMPEEPYGYSKRIIAKSILNQLNFYNIRIFGLFDENELDTRFIKANIKHYINKLPIEIHQDKVMDFFYMKDLISLVEYYINNDNLPKQIDCSYNQQYKLSDIANIINNLDSHKVDIIFEKKELDIPYYGKSNALIKYIGLEQGIKEVHNKIKNEY